MGTGKTYSTKYLLDSNNNSGVAGQVLSTTSTGIDWVDANTVPGAGLWLESGNDIYNSNSGNVGIGTTSPDAQLEIEGTVEKTYLHVDGIAGNAGIGSTQGAMVKFYNNGDGHTVKIQNNNSSRTDATVFSVWTQTNSRFLIRNDGNVGIGTISPTQKLEVNGAVLAGDYRGSAQIYLTSPDSWIFRSTGGSERMRITSAGNVGIGTTSPDKKLTVNGSVKYNTQITTLANLGQKAFIGISSGSGAQKFKIYKNTNTTDGYARFTIDRAYDYGDNNQMVQEAVFQRRNTTKNFVFKYEGDVATGDDVYLEVYELSNDQVEIWFCIDDFAQSIIEVISSPGTSEIFTSPSAGTPTGTLIHSSNPDTETPNWDSYQGDGYFAGNVGIGTTNPTEKLVVQDGKVLAGHTNTRGYGFHDLSNYTYTANTGRLSLVSNGTEAVSIDSSQNVGIGATSPNSKLDVRQVGDGIALELHNTGGNVDDFVDIKMIAGNTTAGTLGTILRHQRDGSGGGDFSILTNPTLTGTPTKKLIVKSGGNVGIGTTNPTNKLHIQGSQATVYSSTDTGGQASAGTTINNTNTSGNTNNFSQLLFTVGTNNNSVSRIVAIRSGSDASDLAFVGKSTAGVAEYMRIKSGGNVGIGINNPSALLEVRKGSISGQIAKFSAINPHVVIESSTAGNAVLHLKPNATSSKSGQFKVTAGNGYNFRWSNDASGTAETAYMDLDTSTTGGGDLTVKGDVIAYGSPSDKKYKENIKPIESALDKAMQLQGVTFDWKDSESILEIKEDIGFIAQDVQEVLPELVRDNGKGNLSLRYQGITPILLEAIKELKAEIEELKLNNCNCNK